MPPAPATQAIEHLTSTVLTLVGLMVLSAFIAFLAARQFGGKSRTTRQTIFSVVSFIGICSAGIFVFNR